jgi:glycosyltransferase involved in cell wall biosynthesis
MVIEHSACIDPKVRYSGERVCGITVINGMQHRARIVGLDLFLAARERVALEAVGMETEAFGGLGDIPYRELHQRMAPYRFLFSPIRYTSLPLAVIEAMTIGMPVIALATTALPGVIEQGVNGYLSCDQEELIGHMKDLLAHPDEARRLGANARKTAERRFGLARFQREWNLAFQRAIELRRGALPYR